MQVYSLVRPVVINPRNAGSWNFQFNFLYPAAIKQLVGKQKQKAAAFTGLARFSGASEKIHSKAHRQNWPAAEARINPFAVAPAHPGNIADDPEKDDCNDNPLLIT